MSANEAMDTGAVLQPVPNVLEVVAGSCNQVEVDYFIHCICHGKKDAACNALLEAGISIEDADTFIAEVEALHFDDLQKIDRASNALQMSEEDLIDLAQTILRVLT